MYCAVFCMQRQHCNRAFCVQNNSYSVQPKQLGKILLRMLGSSNKNIVAHLKSLTIENYNMISFRFKHANKTNALHHTRKLFRVHSKIHTDEFKIAHDPRKCHHCR